MPSIRLIISEILLWIYVLLVYQNIMSENGGLFLPGFLGSPDFRILCNIIVLSLAGAAGMAYFAFFYRQLSGTIQKHSPLYAFGGATIGQLLMELFATSNILVTIGLVLSMMGWGYVMAYILYKVATESPGTHFGRFIGVSLGTGAIIAYIIGTIGAFFPNIPISHLLTLPCLALLAFICPKKDYSEIPQASASTLTWHTFFTKNRTYLIIAATFMGILMGLCDSVTVIRFPEYAPSFPTSRLFYAGGLLFFGWLTDKKFSVMPAVVLVISTYFLWFRTFNTEPGLFLLLAQYVEAIYSAPIIVLMMTGFLHIAAHSDRPEKWAAMSRIIELPSMSLGLLFGVLFFQYVSLPVIFATYTTLLLISVALLYKITMSYMQGSAEEKLEKRVEAAVGSHKQEKLPDETARFNTYCKNYHLTEREANVLQELLKGLKISTIAENLFISERTVRFHINNIQNKTGQESQLAIVSDYYRGSSSSQQ